MSARYFLWWLWGVLLASGWWATCLWSGVPVGPNSVPVVGIFTGLGTLGTLVFAFSVLIDSARKGG